MASALFVHVESRTWSREKHHLFDFEADPSTITNQNFAVSDTTNCIRNGDTIDVCSHSDLAGLLSNDTADKLVQVEWRNGRVFLNPPRWGSSLDKPIQRCWKLIRETVGTSSHVLAERDIVKFGRTQFRVRQLSTTGGPVLLDESPSKTCYVDAAQCNQECESACRICLDTSSTMEDPMIRPCQCKGSVSNIHWKCLEHWVHDRLGLTNGDAAIVVGPNETAMNCELCKTPYQTTMKVGFHSEPLVQMKSPFVVLESCNEQRLYVIPVHEGHTAKIGRSNESDLTIHDSSISRGQATIEFVNGAFRLKDQGSRFGTSVKMIRPMQLSIGEEVSVQVGRSILHLSPKPAVSAQLADLIASTVAASDSDEAIDTDASLSSRECGTIREMDVSASALDMSCFVEDRQQDGTVVDL